ncbi:MAG TPA: transketolase, partial [Spirochaeta sp.]|nr:transketolase [Spirochaeta sp.]
MMGMRETYTDSLIMLAEKDERICVLDADLRVGHGTKPFYDRFPERGFNVGVAEANMVGIAAGLSAGGKIPFAETFGCFAARRAYDQFFLSGNYAQLNVKLLGSDPGVTATYNGGTHMPFEDIAMMRVIPGLTIVSPCDPYSLGQLIEPIAYHEGCVYMRMPRKAEQQIYNGNEKLELGKGYVLREGTDITIAATGFVMVPQALKAAELLEKKGISAAVIDFHT